MEEWGFLLQFLHSYLETCLEAYQALLRLKNRTGYAQSYSCFVEKVVLALHRLTILFKTLELKENDFDGLEFRVRTWGPNRRPYFERHNIPQNKLRENSCESEEMVELYLASPKNADSKTILYDRLNLACACKRVRFDTVKLVKVPELSQELAMIQYMLVRDNSSVMVNNWHVEGELIEMYV